MRALVIALVTALAATLALAQGPPLNATPEQLFDAGMNALAGSVSARNNLSALDYFRRSADQGYAPAQVVMGYFADTGTILAVNASDAADWYRKAVDQGDPLAQWLLGRLYVLGSGLPSDYAMGQKTLTPAAEQGNPFAALLLGRILLDRDYTQAPKWFRVAAEQGLPAAQFRYATALRDGRGIPQDRIEAYVWFLIASDGGYPASNELSALDGLLSPDQTDRAKQQARKLEESVSRPVAAHGCTGWEGELNEIPTPPPPRLQHFCR
jgi:TPR repeat protein